MKKLSELFVESFDSPSIMGVTNHYTPINNIIQAVRNLLATRLGVVVEPGEDGVSIKLHSSKFVSDEEINSVLYNMLDRFTSLDSYIRMSGLTKRTIVDLGMYKVVYYSPEDIKQAEDPQTMSIAALGDPDESDIEMTAESKSVIDAIITEDNEEQVKEINWEEILSNEDKNVAAALVEDKFKNNIILPENYYIRATKDANANKCVAIRKKYEFRKPFDEKLDKIKSIMNIYGPDHIWISGYQDCVTLSDTDAKLIESILKFMKAEKTDDPCKYTVIIKKEESTKEEPKKEELE